MLNADSNPQGKTPVIKFPVSSGRSQIAVPIATSEYHAKKLQDLAGGSCRQGSMEIWLDSKRSMLLGHDTGRKGSVTPLKAKAMNWVDR